VLAKVQVSGGDAVHEPVGVFPSGVAGPVCGCGLSYGRRHSSWTCTPDGALGADATNRRIGAAGGPGARCVSGAGQPGNLIVVRNTAWHFGTHSVGFGRPSHTGPTCGHLTLVPSASFDGRGQGQRSLTARSITAPAVSLGGTPRTGRARRARGGRMRPPGRRVR